MAMKMNTASPKRYKNTRMEREPNGAREEEVEKKKRSLVNCLCSLHSDVLLTVVILPLSIC